MSGTNTGMGLFGGDPIDSYTLQQEAPQLVPSTPGEVAGAVAGETLDTGLPLLRLAKQYVRAAKADPASYLASEPGPAFSNPVPALSDVKPEPNVPKDELNKSYGIPGVLSFDQDMPASIAQDLHDHHVAEIQRQDILQRNASGVASGGLARFLVSSAVSLLDPLNVAAQFVPGLPEARVAGALGELAIGAGGRAAVRAITGASQGALGTALLQPIDYLNNKADLDDWNMGTALSSVAFGGLLGGLLHPTLGAVHEALSGRLPPWAAQIDGLPSGLQEAMGRGAINKTVEGEPPTVDPAINTNNALRMIDEIPQVLQAIAERFDNDDLLTKEDARALIGYGPEDTPPDFGQGVPDEIENILQLQNDKGTEHAAFFDPYSNGFVDFQYYDQTKRSVSVIGDIQRRFRDPTEAVIFHHTHPSDNSLSDTDLKTSASPGISAMVAHTAGGETHIAKYLGDREGVEENYQEAITLLRKNMEKAYLDDYFGVAGSTDAQLDYSKKMTDLVNRVLAYGGLSDYISTNTPNATEIEWLTQAGKEMFGDRGDAAIARATRQLARHEAVGEILRRSEEAASARGGTRLRDARRAAYDGKLQELIREITPAPKLPPEITNEDFLAMSVDQKAAYLYQTTRAQGKTKEDFLQVAPQLFDMLYGAQQQAEINAQRMAQNAKPKQSTADASARNEILRRIKEAPEISGRPEDAAKDQATAEKLNADFAEFVAGEKAAGRWTEEDDKALASIQQDEDKGLAGAELCRNLGNCIAGGS